MPRKKKPEETLPLVDIQEMLRTAPCVPALRNAVDNWRVGGYKGVTETTKELLNYWFNTDHVLATRKKFPYQHPQTREIQTLIKVYEVEKKRSKISLLEAYSPPQKDLRLPRRDHFARYCIKMATGSG